MAEGKLHRYEAPGAVVTWDAVRCIHAAECVHGLPQVFDPAAKPWIRPADAAPADLAAVVNRCPSGALRMQFADGASAMTVPAENHGAVTPDGPNYVRGKLTLVVAGETVLEDTRIALCRCGASQHKPFCDNSHRKSGFQHPGALPAESPVPADAESSAPLKIEALTNGPLRCTGPLTLHDREGRTAFAAQTFLCRCGGSHTKPYCDGTHKRIGFVA
jgi:CDGSH-type Zn-finger protein/uncharacterized Fe-S cluster protein YjdI